MMRVVMVTPDSRYIDRRILQEGETIVAQGHEVILLADWQEGLPNHEWIGNIKVERLITSPTLFFSREKAILFVQRKLRIPLRIAQLAIGLSQKIRQFRLHEQAMLNRVIYYDPDVVHIHDLPYLKVGVQAKKRLQVPLVYDAHELYPEIGTLTAKQKRELTQVEARSISHCDLIITVNPLLAEEMGRRYHIPIPKVILNAIAVPDRFKATVKEDRFRRQFPIPSDHQILLFQGWLSLDRGLAELVGAMGHVPPNIHLVLMGYGEEAKVVLTQMAIEARIDHRIHFKEAVSQADLLFWTASADAGIIPYQPVDLNHYYCSPNKLFEFIQAGLPIIANDLPFLRQVVAGEEFGIVLPLTDVASYAQAIQVMFNEEAGGPGRFRKNLLEKAAKYGWQVEETKLLNMYPNLRLKDPRQE